MLIDAMFPWHIVEADSVDVPSSCSPLLVLLVISLVLVAVTYLPHHLRSLWHHAFLERLFLFSFQSASASVPLVEFLPDHWMYIYLLLISVPLFLPSFHGEIVSTIDLAHHHVQLTFSFEQSNCSREWMVELEKVSAVLLLDLRLMTALRLDAFFDLA